MIQNLFLNLLLSLLKLKRLSPENRLKIVTALLDKSHGFPIKDVITFDIDGTVMIRGKKLDKDGAISLRESAISLSNNWFYKVMKEQIDYEAIKMGVYSSVMFDQLFLSKAALWVQQQERILLNKVTPEDEEVV